MCPAVAFAVGLLYSSIAKLAPCLFNQVTSSWPCSLEGFLSSAKSAAKPLVCLLDGDFS